MEALAQNVLSPLSIERHWKAIASKKYSIACDVSNKGNVKLFPIAIQYFDINNGINNFVINFYEDSNETSEAIYNNLKKCLNDNHLDFNNLIAFTGDNASVNYGKYHSVYKNFKDENQFIVKANCNCHILYNTIKYALTQLPFDVENLAMKIYAHFSISAKRVEALKSCYEFTDNEYENMKRHVTTRWLSLYPAVNRIIDHIKPLKSYFIGLGTDECPPVINEFVWSKSSNDMTLPELYLHFSSHLMKLFHITIKNFEQKTTNSTNLYDLMFKLNAQLENRLKYVFFGSEVKEKLKFFSEEEQKDFLKNAKNVYKRAIDYLNRNFDMNESPFKLFSSLNLDKDLTYDELIKVSQMLNISVDKDTLFDEMNSFNCFLNNLDVKEKSMDTVSKYCKILSKTDYKNLMKIIETVMAIPIGNDFVERVFSLMKKIWTDERNRMNINIIKAEICIKTNFSMDCQEFKEFIKNNERLIKAVKSSHKYQYN
jgi:hypothetical protein